MNTIHDEAQSTAHQAAAQAPPGGASAADEGPRHAPPPPPPPPAVGENDPRRKNPALAGILSAMPGLGQIYVGYYPRGFVHVVVVGCLIALLNSGDFRDLEPLMGMFLAFFWLYNIIDAVRRASLYNQVLAGGSAPALPDDFKMPSMGGSVFGGIALLVAGFVLLLHTRFQMPLDFLQEWWPLLPMGFGAFLLIRAMQDRAARAGGTTPRNSGESSAG